MDEISKKYSLKLDILLSSVKRKKRNFKLKSYTDEKDILVHSILDTNPYSYIIGNEQLRQIHVTLSDDEVKTVKEKFDYYWKEYLKERDALLFAFIIKNEIGIVEDKSDTEIDKDISAIITYMDVLGSKKFNQKKLG